MRQNHTKIFNSFGACTQTSVHHHRVPIINNFQAKGTELPQSSYMEIVSTFISIGHRAAAKTHSFDYTLR